MEKGLTERARKAGCQGRFGSLSKQADYFGLARVRPASRNNQPTKLLGTNCLDAAIFGN